MKKRIESSWVLQTDYKTKFFQKFKEQFEYFLGNRKEEKVYVHDVELENELNLVLKEDESKIIYLIGEAGIGKTTVLKKVLHVKNNNVFFDEENKIIYLCLSFHGKLASSDIKQIFTNSINSLCSKLEQKFEIRDDFTSKEGIFGFYDYVEDTVIDLLGYTSFVDSIGLDDYEEKKYKLRQGEIHDRYSFEASRLKFYLQKYCLQYKKIILIVDNIEVFPSNARDEIVRDSLSTFSCFRNQVTNNSNYNIFNVDLFISVRHTTFSELMKQPDISAYQPIQKIFKEKSVDMTMFIEKEYEALINTSISKDQKWTDAYTILYSFCTKFSCKYSSMIQNLCNYNFEKIKECYYAVLKNNVWLFRGQNGKEYDNITTASSIFNNISVIRSIACRGILYRSEKSDIIPNLFVNDEFNDDSMIAMIIICYFYKRQVLFISRDDNTYRTKSKILSLFNTIYHDDEIVKSVDRVIEYFIKHNVLRRSIENDEYLLLSPRGVELWEMLQSDSVLLEMYREDHFLDTKLDIDWTSSYEFMECNSQNLIFLQLLIYLKVLLNKEKELKKAAIKNDKLEFYYSCFGRRQITKHLLEGVLKSIEYSGNINNSSIQNELEDLRSKIKEVDMLK